MAYNWRGSGINILTDITDVYIDNNNIDYNYVYTSTIKTDAYQYTEFKTILNLKNKTINEYNLGYKAVTTIEDTNKDIIPNTIETFTDNNGNIISNEDYDLLEANQFNSNSVNAKATFKWLTYEPEEHKNISTISIDNLSNLLKESLYEFHIILN